VVLGNRVACVALENLVNITRVHDAQGSRGWEVGAIRGEAVVRDEPGGTDGLGDGYRLAIVPRLDGVQGACAGRG
jgi:hypothetical protein